VRVKRTFFEIVYYSVSGRESQKRVKRAAGGLVRANADLLASLEAGCCRRVA